jgi:glycosyltransferase involved in cell wall biosynthesis
VHDQRTVIYHHRTRGRGVEGIHISGIVNSFRRRNWVVRVVSPPGVSIEGMTAVSDTTTPSKFWAIVCDYSPQILFEILEVVYNLYSLRELRREITKCSPAFIYERYSLFNWAGTFIARRRKIPIVLEVNDATVITRSRPLAARWLARKIEKWTFNNATHLVTVSQPFRELIAESHDIPSSRIRILSNAVDAGRFPIYLKQPAEKNTNEEFTVGMVGAFVAWHGVHFLVNALSDFLKRTSSKLLLVGDGPERNAIEQAIDQHQLRNNVEITGFVPAALVPALLHRMDVCVMANSNEHGSPMKIFEYMAASKAVVAPCYGPIEEVITHQVDGWLFTPLNPSSLCEALETLHRNPALRTRLGSAARRTIMNGHTWDHRVREIESWIRPKGAMSTAAGAMA